MWLPAPPIDDKLYTKEEYFELAERSRDKLEYHDGRIVLRAGVAEFHDSVTTNFIFAVGKDPNGCKISSSGLAISIPTHARYVYPDLAYTCQEREFEPGSQLRLKNPALLIEVLSESTAEFDRSEKFILYRSLPSFREYILIDSRKIRIDSFYRGDEKNWEIQNLWKEDQELYIHTLDRTISVSEIYEGVSPLEDNGIMPLK